MFFVPETGFKSHEAPLFHLSSAQGGGKPPTPPMGRPPVAIAAIGHACHAFTTAGGCNMGAYSVDILAVGFFLLEWTVYAVTLEHTAYGRNSLSARMHAYREIWIRRLLDREARMVDMQIMASLQNGTAFFASPSLLAVGGALAL